MGEPHLDPLSLIFRSGERLCPHLPPCDIASILVKIARDLARLGGGAAFGSDGAHVAVMLRGAVQQRPPIMHGAAGPQQFAVWTNIDPTLAIPAKVRAREDTVLSITHLPDRDVRDDLLLLDQPAKEFARPIGCQRQAASALSQSVARFDPTSFW